MKQSDKVKSASKTWPYVLAFAELMEAKLEKNRHKGDRDGWISDSEDELYERLKQESRELGNEIRKYESPEKIALEAVDVANFAMMIADVAGELEIRPISDSSEVKNELSYKVMAEMQWQRVKLESELKAALLEVDKLRKLCGKFAVSIISNEPLLQSNALADFNRLNFKSSPQSESTKGDV